ncbi:hypothetical protein [Natrinema marinum]|uniref:hypothetical protein n=1 Tax=Natrinema marinum TaxID=2961598 RepID=UPI0020C9351E|nr:hypothetical protein [Natrinema marinum]
MEIRQRVTAVSRRLRDGVRSAAGGNTETNTDETDRDDRGTRDGVADSVGNLFHCSRCSAVYIATDKRVCSECEEEVEQVRSTLACRGP